MLIFFNYGLVALFYFICIFVGAIKIKVMKVELKEKKSESIKYPFLGVSSNGQYITNWDIKNFRKYSGVIKLSND